AQHAQYMKALGDSGALDAIEASHPVLTQGEALFNTVPVGEVRHLFDAKSLVVPVSPQFMKACQGLPVLLRSRLASTLSNLRVTMVTQLAPLKDINAVPVFCQRLTLPQGTLPLSPTGTAVATRPADRPVTLP